MNDTTMQVVSKNVQHSMFSGNSCKVWKRIAMGRGDKYQNLKT